MRHFGQGFGFLIIICGILGIHQYYADTQASTVNESRIVKETRGTEEKDTEHEDLSQNMRPKIALTFDDGPHPYFTEDLLDGLKERGVKATFFVVGKNIPGNEEVLKRMSEEGHLIGNHTYDHVKIDSLSPDAACQQLMDTSDLVKKITGKETSYIRPPFGIWDTTLECGITMIPVMWTIDPMDWNTSNVSQIVNKVVTKAEENDIILMHDYYKSSVQAALQIVDILTEKGFDFVTVEELILE